VFGTGSATVDIVPSAFLIDNCENIYVSGWGGNLFGYNGTGSTTNGLPITGNAFQNTTDGSDFYFMVLTKAAKTLWYATYFGGSASQEHVDGGTSRFDKTGVIYQSVCGGCGGLSDFPTTGGVWSPTNQSSNCNNAIIKFNFDLLLTVAEFKDTVNALTGCAPFCATFENKSKNGKSYFWDFGDGDTSNVKSPTHCYTIDGTYTVMLVTINPLSCNLRDTTYSTVTVFPALHIPPLRDTSLCAGASVIFKTTNRADLTYDWQPSTFLNNSTTYTVTATPPVGFIIYTLKVTDGNGCKDSTKAIVLVNDNSTKINLSGASAFCKGDSAVLTASALNQTYMWSTNEITPSITVKNTAGYYYLTTKSVDGCVAKDFIYINVKPLPIPNISTNATVCLGSSLNLIAHDGDSYTWLPTTYLSSATIANPVTQPTSTIKYIVAVSKQGCVVTDSVTITVAANTTTISIVGDTVFCNGDSVKLIGNAPHASYLWYTNKTTPFIYATQSGQYWLKTTDVSGCAGYDTVNVRVLSKIKAGNDLTVCGGQFVQLTASGSNGVYSWTPTADVVNPNVANPSVYVTTSHYYYVTASDGCNADSVYVSAKPYPTVKARSDSSIYFGNHIQLYATSTSSVVWSPNYKLSCVYCPAPTATPDTSINYIVQVTNTYGCTARDTVRITVIELPALYVPNSFTPNHDKVNDGFKPYFNALKTIEWRVYDRWGLLIYDTNDLKGLWDGTYKGLDAPQDVYVYKVTAVDVHDVTIEKTGTVTLIR
jgi:gliding motility-associated-like protein